jgi:PEP-CTERM motif-containing protein
MAAGLTLGTEAGASVITSDPTLPVLGVPFAASGGGSCFPTAGVCFQFGSLTFTSVIGSPPAPAPFNASGQDILANAFFTGELTDTSFNPLGLVTLTGTVEQEVLGRTTATQTGSWATELLAVNLAGTVLGHNLTMTLDSGTPSTGTTSIVPITVDGNNNGTFRVDSFFDVFVDLTLDTPTPLHATRSAHLEAAPEPASVALLTMGLLSLAASRRRRR